MAGATPYCDSAASPGLDVVPGPFVGEGRGGHAPAQHNGGGVGVGAGEEQVGVVGRAHFPDARSLGRKRVTHFGPNSVFGRCEDVGNSSLFLALSASYSIFCFSSIYSSPDKSILFFLTTSTAANSKQPPKADRSSSKQQQAAAAANSVRSQLVLLVGQLGHSGFGASGTGGQVRSGGGDSSSRLQHW